MDGMDNEFPNYNSVICKVRKCFWCETVILISLFIIVICYEYFAGGSPLAICAEICLYDLREIFINLAPIYGIIMSLVAVFVVYKRDRISERLSKYSDEFKTPRNKWDRLSIMKEEEAIIDMCGEIYPKLTHTEKKRIKYIYDFLCDSSGQRKQLTLHIIRFTIFNFVLFIFFILFLFFWKINFLNLVHKNIFDLSLFFITISTYITIRLGCILKS